MKKIFGCYYLYQRLLYLLVVLIKVPSQPQEKLVLQRVVRLNKQKYQAVNQLLNHY